MVDLRGGIARLGKARQGTFYSAVQVGNCLDIFWLKDESLEDSAKLPEPHVLAEEITDDLRSALEQIESVLGDLTARTQRMSAREAEPVRQAEPTFVLEPSSAQPQKKAKRRGAGS